MKNSASKYATILLRKSVTIVLLTASVAAFATLGEGSKRDSGQHRSSLLLRNTTPNFKNFTLRSGINYRGNTIFNPSSENKYFLLNRVMTYQKGNQTYILPMKKKVLLDKVTFNPKQH